MGKYKKCPRCDLNYIPADSDLCDVCKAELKLAPNIFADDEELEEEGVLCPVCRRNYIGYDEDMCASCKEKLESARFSEEEDDENWRTFLDDDKPLPDSEIDVLSLAELEKEEGMANDDEEEDDKFADSADDIDESEFFDDDFDDEDFDEDEDEDDEDEDE